MNFKYGAEALALAGIAFGLIKWVGRTLRSQLSDDALDAARLEGIASHTAAASADALVRQGIVSAEQLSGMTARERQFLLAATAPKVEALGSQGRTSRPTPWAAGAVIESASIAARAPSPTPPRLHLITPSRPPLGMAVHCPACGVPLDREALQRYGATTCPRCKRPVSAHIQRGRVTVIIEETVEEAEHRRRVDGNT